MAGDALSVLALSGAYGLTAAGLVAVIRSLSWVEKRVFAGKRPWACDLCMCFWATLFIVAIAVLRSRNPELFSAWLPSIAIAIAVTSRLRPYGTSAYVLPPDTDYGSERDRDPDPPGQP